MSVNVSRSVESIESTSARASQRLVRSAISGLLGLGVLGCTDDGNADDSNHDNDHESSLTDSELQALCADMIDEAKKSVDLDMVCADEVDEAKKSVDLDLVCSDKLKEAAATAKSEADKMCTTQVTDLKTQCEPILLSAEEKSGDSEQKEYTFAALTKKCDDLGGYIQIHSSCSSVNQCKGFSYGDWGADGATVTEHTCSGVNGCKGLSCVVMPKDQGRSGKDILEQKEPFGKAGPAPCNYCHATDWDEEAGTFDATKFRVLQMPEGTRTAANWLDRTQAEQERIVAFGSHGVRADGIAYSIMGAYKDVLSRAEIERVVTYIRTLPPVMTDNEKIKIKDPM